MRYAIVGNGIAGITAAFALRESDPRASITVIGGESRYHFSRPALMYSFMGRLSRRDMEAHPRELYREQRLTLVEAKATNLDADAHTLTLSNGANFTYDRLLIATGSLPNQPQWARPVREGVVHFVTLSDLDRCERRARRGGRAVVVGGGLIGIELAECLHHHGMHVTFLVREPWYWPAGLDAEEASMISDHLRERGITVEYGEEVAQVSTDAAGQITQVETVSGKQLACELLGVAVGVHPAVEWLREVRTSPELARGVLVDDSFRTSLNDVWAAGDCAEIRRAGEPPLVEQLWYSARRQGGLAARSMCGETVAYRPPVFANSAKFLDIEYTTVGRLEGHVSFFARLPQRRVSIRIAHQAGVVQGFNMLGSRWDASVLARWIEERRTLANVLAHLGEAQFDAECERVDVRALIGAHA